MRILMAVVSDITTDARVRREANALAEAGHDVEVVAFDYRISAATRRVEEGVHYRLFPFPSRDSSREKRVLGAAVFFLRAAWAILTAGVDAVHSHNLHLAIPCLIRARLSRAPLVFDAHEVTSGMLSGITRAIGLRYEDFIWHAAAATITTNESRADHLVALHGEPRPVILGNYPAEPAELRPVDLRGQLGIPPGDRILIYQGGLYLHARCFAEVAEALASCPGWHWVLVGFGSTRTVSELHELLNRAGIGDRSYVLPPVPSPELLHITAGADAGVVPLLPLVGNELGDTNKLFEYLVAGLPVIASDFPEVRKPLLDNPIGPVGTVFDAENPATIVEAINRLEDDFATFRERAPRVGRSYYTWSVERPKLVDLYASLGARRDGRTH